MQTLPCSECGGLPCQEGCNTIDFDARLRLLFELPTCVHGVITLDPCADCEALAERAAAEYATECAANRAALGIV
jgi:hypothetical protein